MKTYLIAWMEAMENLSTSTTSEYRNYALANARRAREMFKRETGEDLRPKDVHEEQVRERIAAALRRRAAKREESLVTAEQAMEDRMLRRIASMIEDGTEGLDP